MKEVSKNIWLKIIIGLLLGITTGALAQHRGDNLAFQGFSNANDIGVKALAQGGAYTAITGDINSLYYNPAGLADIEEMQFNISVNNFEKSWRENQVYRPNRFLLTLPFYLEGLYIPDPANNGMWDYEIFDRDKDSLFVVNQPVLGEDPFGEKAADWDKSKNNFVFNNIAAAIPINLSGKKLVFSASYNRKYDVLDFDRNDTYTDPHLGFDEYGVAERVTNDTLQVNWYRFLRQRTGDIKNVNAAVAYQVNNFLNVGIGFNTLSGETNEVQNLNKVGWFDLARNNRLRFSYDTLNTNISGKSEFSATSFNFGASLKLNRVNIGFNVVLPHTLQRTWNSSTQITDTLQTVNSAASGVDEMDVPTTYSFGISFNPVDRFLVSFDYEQRAFSNATFNLATNDTTHREWVDKNIIRFGAQFKVVNWLSLLAGYRNLPETFVPDGSAFRDRGPAADSYTFGISLNILQGQLDAAYEIRTLKYYDSYFSNTNYVLETYNNFLLGYTIKL